MKMAMWATAYVVLLAAAPLGADEKKDAKSDASKFVGTWSYVSGEKNGEKIPADHLKEKVVITKDSLTLTGEMKFVMSYELDTSKKPVGIKLKMTESPFGAGATAEGIIEVKGDELKFCYAPEGKAPEKFEAKEGSKHHYFVLKRAK